MQKGALETNTVTVRAKTVRLQTQSALAASRVARLGHCFVFKLCVTAKVEHCQSGSHNHNNHVDAGFTGFTGFADADADADAVTVVTERS